MNDRRHHIAGRKNHRTRLDLTAVLQLNTDREPGRIEFKRFSLEQAGTAGDRNPEQSPGQLHRVGICRHRRHNRARASNPEFIEQHRMVEEIAGQTGALAKLMFSEQLLVLVLPAAK